MSRSQNLKPVPFEPRAELEARSDEELQLMAQAGQELLDIHRILAKTGDNVVGELLRDRGTFYEWDHYPPGDVYDRETHSQYYYHAHTPEQRFETEHGHFHTFVRPRGMPEGIAPARIPGFKAPDDPNDALSHLVAIAMNAQGLPFRLFTVNRWVTGETWYEAKDVVRLLEVFEIDQARPSWPVNRWITAMIRLFRPTIAELLLERDRCVEAWKAERQPKDVFEDRALEVTSFADISIEEQIRAVGQTLLSRA